MAVLQTDFVSDRGRETVEFTKYTSFLGIDFFFFSKFCVVWCITLRYLSIQLVNYIHLHNLIHFVYNHKNGNLK